MGGARLVFSLNPRLPDWLFKCYVAVAIKDERLGKVGLVGAAGSVDFVHEYREVKAAADALVRPGAGAGHNRRGARGSNVPGTRGGVRLKFRERVHDVFIQSGYVQAERALTQGERGLAVVLKVDCAVWVDADGFAKVADSAGDNHRRARAVAVTIFRNMHCAICGLAGLCAAGFVGGVGCRMVASAPQSYVCARADYHNGGGDDNDE